MKSMLANKKVPAVAFSDEIFAVCTVFMAMIFMVMVVIFMVMVIMTFMIIVKVEDDDVPFGMLVVRHLNKYAY